MTGANPPSPVNPFEPQTVGAAEMGVPDGMGEAAGAASAPPLVAVRGSYGEMGAAYGEQTALLVEGNVADYLKRFRDSAGLTDQQVRSRGGRYRSIVAAYNADIADMLDGLADGSGLPAEYIYALNARTEILYGARSSEDACTSVAVLPTHTSDGHVLLAENWDWHPEQQHLTLLLSTVDESGFAVLTLAEAGMIAKVGMNSAGLGVCANLLVCDRDGSGDGVPYHLLLRGVLQSRTMAHATRAALTPDRVSSGNILIGDAGGETIDLEVVPDDFGYVLPTAGMVAHSNHFVSGVPVRDMRKAVSALSLLRPTRARHLLEPALETRSVTISDLQAVLRDHYSFPNSICRHVDEADDPSERECSLYSMVMDLTDRSLFIAAHPACENFYVRFLVGNLLEKAAD